VDFVDFELGQPEIAHVDTQFHWPSVHASLVGRVHREVGNTYTAGRQISMQTAGRVYSHCVYCRCWFTKETRNTAPAAPSAPAPNTTISYTE